MSNTEFWELLPWGGLMAFIVLMLVLALVLRFFPSVWTIAVLACTVVASIVGVVFPALRGVVLAVDVICVVLLAFDFFTLLRPYQIRVQRDMMRTGSLGKPHSSKITIDNLSRVSWSVDVRDDVPAELEPTPAYHSVQLPPRQAVELEFLHRPLRRGAFQFEYIYLKRHSILRLWTHFDKHRAQAVLNVYPDMQQLSEYALLAKTNRLSLIGVRRTRKIGQDNNFERLRDYSKDDNYKHIDWRSTARRNKLTVKQFQSDQSQRVMFLLDCGRMMTSEYRNLSFVDHALNAILMLSYVALSQGDSVGMMAFSDRVHSFVPLRSGQSQMNRLLHAGFDRFAGLMPSRFDKAFLHFNANCRRRSMVFLITNVNDDVSATEVSGYLSNLSSRHLPVLALLRDERIFNSADNPTQDEEVFYRSAAAAHILLWRAELIRRMQHKGVLAIDAYPSDLTSNMVNRYLEAKAKHLL